MRRLQGQENRWPAQQPWLQIPIASSRTDAPADTSLRWVGITLCLLWLAQQLSRLITWLRQWGQRDPLSQAFQRELLKRGLLLH